MVPLSSPTAPVQERPAADDAIAASEDLLLEFFDFFDRSVNDVFGYIQHRTRMPEIAEEITLELYFSLLQRHRFFWWRNVIDLPTIFSMADKAIAKTAQWQQAASGMAYVRAIAEDMPGSQLEERMERARLVLNTLEQLPLQEQKVAIIRFFLRWSPAQAAAAFKMNKDAVKAAYERVLTLCTNQLNANALFHDVRADQALCAIKSVPLDPAKKAAMRVAILEKFRTAQLSSLRYVMPVAALLLVVTTATSGIGYVAVEPLSAQKSIRTAAAAESLLLDDERTLVASLSRAEQTSRSLAASFAERDIANIALDLTGPAIDEQVALEYDVYTTLRSFSTQALFSLRRAIPSMSLL